MICINIIAEGNSEEAFVKDVLTKYFSELPNPKFLSVRRITTGWDWMEKKPAKGGGSRYPKFRNDILRWIDADRGRSNMYYTSFVDLYSFPVDKESPYTESIRTIHDPFTKIVALEKAFAADINHSNFIPYVQLHEFESFVLADPTRLITMYPEYGSTIKKLKDEIGQRNPELINESPETAPSKRISKYIPEYEGQKAQVGPLVAQDIGLPLLREKCAHFNEWITKLENL